MLNNRIELVEHPNRLLLSVIVTGSSRPGDKLNLFLNLLNLSEFNLLNADVYNQLPKAPYHDFITYSFYEGTTPPFGYKFANATIVGTDLETFEGSKDNFAVLDNRDNRRKFSGCRYYLLGVVKSNDKILRALVIDCYREASSVGNLTPLELLERGTENIFNAKVYLPEGKAPTNENVIISAIRGTLRSIDIDELNYEKERYRQSEQARESIRQQEEAELKFEQQRARDIRITLVEEEAQKKKRILTNEC